MKNRQRLTQKDSALPSFSLTRIILPVLLGVSVVGYLFVREFDAAEYAKISGRMAFTAIVIAVVFLMGRIAMYAWRLMILSKGTFGFWKSVQLVFIWTFSSAVSPTNVGGSAVALFILSQEPIGAARATPIVIYTIVLDTFFHLLCIPLWLILFGRQILGPAASSFGGWEATLLTSYFIMLAYGLFFAYGLLINPVALKKLPALVARIPLLRRYRKRLNQLGEDLIVTSKALAAQGPRYHLGAILTTIGAWSFQFLLVLALVAGTTRATLGLWTSLELYARIQTMYMIIALTPTPGGSGFAEILFGNLLSDFVPSGISLVVASLWRALSYYFFLLVGIIIIPPWLNQVIRRRKQKRRESGDNEGKDL